MSNKINPTLVKSITPPAAWIGGKRLLAKHLRNRIDAMEYTTYVEPFVGMGGVFFKRQMKPKAEVINDASGEVINLFRILQRHYPQFMDTIKFQITSRREFERLSKCLPETLTDLERAARFLYLQRLAFGGKVQGQNFGVSVDLGSRFNLTKLAPMLEDIHERLSGVVIENMDWQDVIKRYDRKATLFYLDPPYWGNEGDYGKALFDRSQFDQMATQLAKIKGRFILSINNRPEVVETFKAFDMEEVELTYSIAGRGTQTPARELIISNS